MANHRIRTYTTRRNIIAALIAAALSLLGLGATAAVAAPITCPAGQVATQVTPGNFACVNNGGNPDNSGKTKNPND
jgi:hypothetical protein